MNILTPSSIDAQILAAVVAPDEPSLTAPFARFLLRLSFNGRQEEEIEALLGRNNVGTITDVEREKLEAYVRVGNFLSLLQTKARGTLARESSK